MSVCSCLFEILNPPEYAYGGHPYQMSGLFSMEPRDIEELGPAFKFKFVRIASVFPTNLFPQQGRNLHRQNRLLAHRARPYYRHARARIHRPRLSFSQQELQSFQPRICQSRPRNKTVLPLQFFLPRSSPETPSPNG